MSVFTRSPVPVTELGPDANGVRRQRRGIKSGLTCQHCERRQERGSLLKACSKCDTPYCSTKCQKADWPRHKKACIGPADGLFPQFNKICQSLLANNALTALIQVLIALELKLNVESEGIRNQRASVQIFVHFEPVDDFDFLQITDSNIVLDASAMPGMLQIGAISSTGDLEGLEGLNAALSPSDAAAVPSSSTSSAGDVSDDLPEVRVQFVRILPSGHCQSMTTSLVICREAIESSKETREVHLPLRNRVAEIVPVSTDAYRDFINELIRLDTENRWLLRMNMQQRDKEVYRAAGIADSSLPDSLGQLIREPGMRRIRAIFTTLEV